MPGTRAGGLKAKQKLLNKDPNFYATMGAKGGSRKGLKKGFAVMDKERLTEVSAKGGTNSRRKKK